MECHTSQRTALFRVLAEIVEGRAPGLPIVQFFGKADPTGKFTHVSSCGILSQTGNHLPRNRDHGHIQSGVHAGSDEAVRTFRLNR